MKSLYIAGDSHVQTFKYIKRLGIRKDEINILGYCMAPGKTAQGLHKQTNRDIFTNRIQLDTNGKTDYVALQFGEVDCGYTLWSRMQLNNTTKEEEVIYAVEGIELLAEALGQHAEDIILLEPIIPLMSSYKDAPEMLKRRKTFSISHKERTELALQFNKCLKETSLKLGYLYASINDHLLDTTTGIARSQYCDKPSLHHLGIATSANLWMDELIKVIYATS